MPWTGEEIGLFFERLPRGRRRGVQAVTTAEVKAVEPPTAEEHGGRLFDALFRDKIRDAYLRSRECLGAQGLRLQLRLDPSIGEAAALHRLPWELLYRADAKEWIARDRRTPIVRYLAVDHPAKLPPVPRPLRLLVVMANPRGSVPLDLESERRNLEKLWRQHAAVEVEILPRPEETTTLRNVRETLREAELRGEDFHVLHFMGHGHIDPATGEGRLDFEDEAGENDAVSGADLADVLVDVSGVRLVVLNACHSGEMNRANPAAGVATSLVRGGMPAVIAMQTAITDRAAAAFSRELYHVLACGEPLDAAVTEDEARS